MDATRKPECEYQDEVRVNKQRIATMTRREKIEASVKNVLEQLIREESTSVGAVCTREIVKGIIDSFGEKCTRRMAKELSNMATCANNGIDLAEVYSPPRMTTIARKFGLQRWIRDGPGHGG